MKSAAPPGGDPESNPPASETNQLWFWFYSTEGGFLSDFTL